MWWVPLVAAALGEAKKGSDAQIANAKLLADTQNKIRYEHAASYGGANPGRHVANLSSALEDINRASGDKSSLVGVAMQALGSDKDKTPTPGENEDGEGGGTTNEDLAGFRAMLADEDAAGRTERDDALGFGGSSGGAGSGFIGSREDPLVSSPLFGDDDDDSLSSMGLW